MLSLDKIQQIAYDEQYFTEYCFTELRFKVLSTRKEQKIKRQKEILVAGLELFTSKGYAATNVSDIAVKVGMSIGLFYNYYESKEKLYEELIKRGISGPMSVMGHTDQSAVSFFEHATRHILFMVKNEPIIAKMFILMGQAAHNEALPQSVKAIMSDYDIHASTVLIIEKGQADGTIREGNPLALSIAYWRSVQGIAEEIALHPDSPCPNSEWIVDIVRNKNVVNINNKTGESL